MTAEPAFHFEVEEGTNLNYFVRDGKIAAHLLLRSSPSPRLLVAFPAGNSGVGLWFEAQKTAAPQWVVDRAPVPTTDHDTAGRQLFGISFDASIAAGELVPKQAVLSSIRVLRDYQSLGTAPSDVLAKAQSTGKTLTWARDRLDGAPGYRLSVEVIRGSLNTDGRISAGADGKIALHVTALSGETPLTPLANSALFRAQPTENRR